MKKFGLYLSCVILIMAQGLGEVDFSSVGADYFTSVHTFYISDPQSVPEMSGEIKVISNGYFAQVTCPGYAAPDVKKGLKSVSGESVSFKASKDKIAEIISKYQIETKETQQGENFYTVYGYSPRFKEYAVEIDKETINIQIAYRNGYITIGSPVILGSF